MSDIDEAPFGSPAAGPVRTSKLVWDDERGEWVMRLVHEEDAWDSDLAPGKTLGSGEWSKRGQDGPTYEEQGPNAWDR